MSDPLSTLGFSGGGFIPPHFTKDGKHRRLVKWGLDLPYALQTTDGRRENVRANAFKGHMLEICEPHDRVAAICGFGPSLSETIEELRALDADVFTTSGAHDFVISRGIVPKGHVEIDPRPHKARFLENPHKEVTYYLATCCDVQAFENVRSNMVRVWNLHSAQGDDEFYQSVYGKDAFSLDVGCSVGNAAMVIAGCLGYRTMHVFGMDCSKKDGQRHAGTHYGPPQKNYDVNIDGRNFETTPQMVAAAQDFFTLVARMGGVNVEVHGDGLLQHWCDQIMERNKNAA